jgi:hypothetical protein
MIETKNYNPNLLNALAELIKDKFNEEINHAKTLNTFLNTDIINSKNSLELYKNYYVKNKDAEKVIKYSHSDILTNDRKSYYENQEKNNLKGWYNIFYVSYYILASPVSADYHLIVFFGPLLLLLKDYENSNNKDLYIVLILTIAFIVSPQHYYFTEKFIPEKTILNPLLILFTNLYILVKTNYSSKKI